MDVCDQICGLNEYTHGARATSCTDCPPNYFAGYGSGSCSFCAQGQYQDLIDDEVVCIDCDAGWYSALGIECEECGPGYATENSACPRKN